jgi:hypothetical protein
MGRGRSRFRQRELTRALKGARAAGIDITQFEIDYTNGRFLFVTTPSARTDKDSSEELNEWDAA